MRRLVSKMDLITMALGVTSFLVFFAAIIYSVINNKNHKTLCSLFIKEFGFLPGGIILAQAGGIFLTFQKDLFFLFPLIVSEDNFIVRDMKSEHYNFVRTLPSEITLWIKIKYILFSVSIILMLISYISYSLLTIS